MPDDLRNADLNLLVVFDTIWSERSVSRAAGRLYLTQSAVSAALRRLRNLFEDDLFVRAGRTMVPTGKAELLAPRIRSILNQIRETIALDIDTPHSIHREFTLATADYVEWLFGGRLMSILGDEAPNISIYFTAIKSYMTQGRNSAETELFLCPAGVVNTVGLSHRFLYADRYVCIAAADNGDVHTDMAVDDFLSFPHVAFTSDPKLVFSHETRHLQALDVRLRNQVLTPHYLAMPLIVTETRGVAIVPERLARFMSAMMAVKFFTPPIEFPDIELNLYWNSQYDADRTHLWLRDKIAAIADDLPVLPDRSPN